MLRHIFFLYECELLQLYLNHKFYLRFFLKKKKQKGVYAYTQFFLFYKIKEKEKLLINKRQIIKPSFAKRIQSLNLVLGRFFLKKFLLVINLVKTLNVCKYKNKYKKQRQKKQNKKQNKTKIR